MPCRIFDRSYMHLSNRHYSGIGAESEVRVGSVAFSGKIRVPVCARCACAHLRACARVGDGAKNLHILHLLHFPNGSKGLQRVGF
jgi:hypothetical protein